MPQRGVQLLRGEALLSVRLEGGFFSLCFQLFVKLSTKYCHNSSI